MCWPFSNLKTPITPPHGLVEGTQVPVCRGASMWFGLPESPAQLAFLPFHFQFNTNLGTDSLCWVTRKHSINVLFEVKYILRNSNHPQGQGSWNLVQSDVESDLFSASYQSSVKQLLYPVLCPRGHQLPLRPPFRALGDLVSLTGPPVCTCLAKPGHSRLEFYTKASKCCKAMKRGASC